MIGKNDPIDMSGMPLSMGIALHLSLAKDAAGMAECPWTGGQRPSDPTMPKRPIRDQCHDRAHFVSNNVAGRPAPMAKGWPCPMRRRVMLAAQSVI